MNRVTIVGRLGRDPETVETKTATTVVRLRVATDEREKHGDEWTKATEWHSVTVFGRTAENCARFLSKGRQVAIEGRLKTTKYTDKTGADRWRTDIIASNVEFIGGRGDAPAPAATNDNVADDLADIPF